MLGCLLIGLLVIEFGLFASMGVHMYGDQMMMHHVGEFSICFVIYVLLARLLVVVASFVFAGLNNRQRPPQSGFKWLKTIGSEYIATVFAFSYCIPLAWLLAPRLDSRSINGQPVVLLVHGLFSNSGVWWLFARRLRRSGRRVDSLELTPVFGDMDTYVALLQARVAELTQRGATSIALIGHSMGGLVCRAYLSRQSAQPANAPTMQLITLGSPHGGSLSAWCLPATHLRQMRPGSDWLRQLPSTCSVPATSVYSMHDNLVIPYQNARSEALAAEEWRGIGHVALMFDRRIFLTVDSLLGPLAPPAALGSSR